MLRVSISISDPWDLGEELGWPRFHGELEKTVDDAHGGRGLIRLDTPIVRDDHSYRYLVASPRHEGNYLAELLSGRSLPCGLVGITVDKPEITDALDTSKWRGGLAFIGTVEPISSISSM